MTQEFVTTSLGILQLSKTVKSSHRLYTTAAFGQTPTPNSSNLGQDGCVNAERQTVITASLWSGVVFVVIGFGGVRVKKSSSEKHCTPSLLLQPSFLFQSALSPLKLILTVIR